MKNAKLQQFTFCLLAILSLFASSVSACACSHHQEKEETEVSSCHSHSTETKSNQNQDGNLPETLQSTVSESGCVCFQPAPKIIVKSENIKVEKHISAIQTINPLAIVFVQQTFSVKVGFPKPLYLSDSFYNLSPGRAPPGL